jgi:PIN domain nuclease of toxin-antitoxin system
MTRAVLDASALIALVFQEPGGDRVEAIVAECAVTTVNLGEVVSFAARQGFSAQDIHMLLDPLPFERVAFDNDLAYATGLLLPLTRPAGLSIGDRACLALATRLGVPAVTADRAWKTIADVVGVKIELIR